MGIRRRLRRIAAASQQIRQLSRFVLLRRRSGPGERGLAVWRQRGHHRALAGHRPGAGARLAHGSGLGGRTGGDRWTLARLVHAEGQALRPGSGRRLRAERHSQPALPDGRRGELPRRASRSGQHRARLPHVGPGRAYAASPPRRLQRPASGRFGSGCNCRCGSDAEGRSEPIASTGAVPRVTGPVRFGRRRPRTGAHRTA